MRVLLVCHYFPPEIGAPQARLSEFARRWAAAGDEVTVLTGMPNHPTGILPPEYKGVTRAVEEVDGYRVVRTWLYATPNEGFVRKTLGHLSFMLSSVVLGGRPTGPADVVVVSSPTFFSIFSGWALARAKRARFVVEVRDLWPGLLVELGVLRSRPLILALEWLELAAYRAADAVVVVTEGFRRDLVRRGVPPEKVHTVPNGADVDFFAPSNADPAATRAELGAAPGDALVLYVGAHGICHGLDAVADAAAKLQGQPIHFAFVGEGATKQRLVDRVRELDLANVTLRPGVPRPDVPRHLEAADICLVPLRDLPLFGTFIPSKMFEYMAAGKAILGSVRGEAAEILRAAGAVIVDPEDAAAMADAVRELARDPVLREAMGDKARAYVAAHYDRGMLGDRYRALLAGLVGRRGR